MFKNWKEKESDSLIKAKKFSIHEITLLPIKRDNIRDHQL